jgi:hypothetical protein
MNYFDFWQLAFLLGTRCPPLFSGGSTCWLCLRRRLLNLMLGGYDALIALAEEHALEFSVFGSLFGEVFAQLTDDLAQLCECCS